MKRVLMQAMQQAICRNDIEAIKRCYRHGASVEQRDVTAEVSRGNVNPETLEFLFKLGLDASTELVSLTVRADKPELLKVVLDAARKPEKVLNKLDSSMSLEGCTVPYLSKAARFKQERMVDMLLEYGASPTFPDSLGEPPLHYALLGNSVPVIQAIEDAIRAEQRSIADGTAAAVSTKLEDELADAIYLRQVERVTRILQAAPVLNTSSAASLWSMLVGCANPKVLPIAKMLLDAGASPVEDGDQQPSGIKQAVAGLDIAMFDMFLASNPESINLESVDYSRGAGLPLAATPLGFALTQHGYNADKFIQYLLGAGAYVEFVNALDESMEALVERCGSDMAKKLVAEFGRTGQAPEFTVEFAPDYAAARAVEKADVAALRKMHETGAVQLAQVRIQRGSTDHPESLLEFLVTTRLPLEQMREVATFLTTEVGLAYNDKVWSFGNREHPLHYVLDLEDAKLIEIMLSAMEPSNRSIALDEGYLLLRCVALGDVGLIRTLLNWGADPLQPPGEIPLDNLQTNHRHLENYVELWSVLQEATSAAQVAQAEKAVSTEESA